MKKTVKPAEARKITARVPFRASFWLCTNDQLRSLKDVAQALERVDDEVFRYHVNRDKNDFEGWIREVIRDKELAREISRIKTRETLIRKIYERLEELRKVLRAKKKVEKRNTKRTLRAKKRKKRVKRKIRNKSRRRRRRR